MRIKRRSCRDIFRFHLGAIAAPLLSSFTPSLQSVICLATMIILAISEAGQVQGGILNYEPGMLAPASILDAGWSFDQINAVDANSIYSPYSFNLTNFTYFRISDGYDVGDTYRVYDFDSLILTTTLYVGEPTGFSGYGEQVWQSPDYSHGEVLLAPGDHYLTIQDDIAGGLPAGFWIQLTTVPEPATICLLAIGSLAFIRRKK